MSKSFFPSEISTQDFDIILAQSVSPPPSEPAPQVMPTVPEPAGIPLSDALGLLNDVASNSADAIATFDYLITIGSAATVLIGLLIVIVFGQQGNKLRQEVVSELDKEVRRAAEARENLVGRIDAIADGVNQRIDIALAQMDSSKADAAEFRKEQAIRQKDAEQSLSDRQLQLQATTDAEFKRLNDRLPTEIDRLVLKKSNELKANLENLVVTANEVETRIARLSKTTLARLENAEQNEKDDLFDPFADYSFVSDFNPNDPSHGAEELEDLRREAVRRLDRIIIAGERGGVDSNLLFNAGMDASRIEFEEQSLKLFTLSNHALSTTSHQLAMYRLQMTIGQRWAVENGTLTRLDGASKDIVDEAFRSALDAAAKAPLEQNEIIYAELWNMSQKVREDNGYGRMLETMLASYHARKGHDITIDDFTDERDRARFEPYIWAKQQNREIPSNLPGKISSIYALIGTGAWQGSYERFLNEAITLAGKESPMTTWRKSCLRDTRETATRLGRLEDWQDMIENAGISEDDANASFNSLPPNILAALQNLTSA